MCCVCNHDMFLSCVLHAYYRWTSTKSMAWWHRPHTPSWPATGCTQWAKASGWQDPSTASSGSLLMVGACFCIDPLHCYKLWSFPENHLMTQWSFLIYLIFLGSISLIQAINLQTTNTHREPEARQGDGFHSGTVEDVSGLHAQPSHDRELRGADRAAAGGVPVGAAEWHPDQRSLHRRPQVAWRTSE